MYGSRSLVVAIFLALSFISCARADESGSDSPITFIRSLDSAPDENVIFAVPRDLDLEKKITIVIFFHGLLGDETFEQVLTRQRVAEQVSEAHVNAILIAPSIDYSMRAKCSGKKKRKRCKHTHNSQPFPEKGSFKKFLKDSVAELAKTLNTSAKTFDGYRIVLVGYSAGHWPTRMALSRDEVTVDGVLLLDAHYGEQDAFVEHAVRVAKRHFGFFVTCYTDGTARRADEFEESVTESGVTIIRGLPNDLLSGVVAIIKIAGEHLHRNFVTFSWTEDPIADLLKRAYATKN
jgi:hypothetical protein